MSPGDDTLVRAGDVLAGKYRVDRVLGVGGMGVVVAATHLQLDQMVALKFVRAEAMANPEVVGRFEREARIAVRLKSEHAARIIDVGRLDLGAPFIVMEYLEGEDLAAVLQRQGAIPLATACDHVIQACDAVSEAHGLGIVHRDLKPGNLFLAVTAHGQRTIKVLDFGISKAQGALGDAGLTRTQAVMGSPGYMSPEQMRSTKNVDGRTDVWSLGVILYELVTGRAPFLADTFTALCLKIAVDPHPPMSGPACALPPGFEAVVQRALEKDPALRYPSATELARALAPYASAHGRDCAQRLVAATAMRPPGVQTVAVAGANTLDAAIGHARTRPPGQSRRWAVAGGAIAVAALIGITLATRSVYRGAGAGPADAAPGGDATGPRVPAARAIVEAGPTAAAIGDAGLAIDAAGAADATNAADAATDAGRPPPVAPRPRTVKPPAAVDPYSSPD